MRLLLFTIFILLSISLTYCLDENCVEQPTDSCSKVSEYNAYITCIADSRRTKRSVGCPLLQESCEYTDCEKCQESCDPSCEDCECPNQCRNCCSQTCSTNLCCHKTCHNQCKTNYCRSECKRECKQRIYEGENTSGSYSSSNKQDIQIVEKNTDTSLAKHNITTIINLHNIINNTNLIDIPIKINNTNYNNITLRRDARNEITNQVDYAGQMSGSFEQQQQEQQQGSNGEKCCYVVGPRQCVKTETYPFTKCFHHRHRRCAPYCISTIVHAQPQNFCDDQGCRNKMFYVPQIQPRCSYQANWPFVSCGSQTFHNCHGCYDHQVNQHHYMRCSKCHDNGFGNGPLYRQGPYYQPPPFYGAAPMYGGFSGAGYMQGYPGAGYPPMASGYPPMASGYPPMMPAYQSYPAYPPMSYSNMGYPGNPNFMGGDEIIDDNQQLDGEPGVLSAKSGDTSNEVGSMLEYPATNYVHETVVTPDQFNPNISIMNDQSKQNKPNNTTIAKAQSSRYAVISISPENEKKHHEKKDKRFKRKKDKLEHISKNEITSEVMLKDEEITTENIFTNSTKSPLL